MATQKLPFIFTWERQDAFLQEITGIYCGIKSTSQLRGGLFMGVIEQKQTSTTGHKYMSQQHLLRKLDVAGFVVNPHLSKINSSIKPSEWKDV